VTTGQFLQLGKSRTGSQTSQKHFTLTIPGHLLEIVAPEIGISADKSWIFWSIEEKQLDELMQTIWSGLSPDTEQIISNIELLPKVENIDLPYRDQLDVDHFTIQHITNVNPVAHRNWDDEVVCKLCGGMSVLRTMITHVGNDILKAARDVPETGLIRQVSRRSVLELD
jgi:hypothetical protein